MHTTAIEELRERGFVVLRAEIDPAPIADEIDRVFLDALRNGDEPTTFPQGSGTVSFRYAPMMCERTPVSLALVDQFSDVAAELLDRPVLPGRAKGTRYFGETAWHRDSAHDMPSLGFLAYLEALTLENGALQVVPGSHLDHDPRTDITDADATNAVAIETAPGDVIVFDEHLVHGSRRGTERRQWRVDFVIDPRDVEEDAAVRTWFRQSIPDERHDPGYDAHRYPSYGAYWQARDRPWTNRLRDLGAYEPSP